MYHVQELLQSAEILEYPVLVQECSDYLALNIDINNSFAIRNLSLTYKLTDLSDHAQHFFFYNYDAFTGGGVLDNVCGQEKVLLLIHSEFFRLVSLREVKRYRDFARAGRATVLSPLRIHGPRQRLGIGGISRRIRPQ